MEHNYPIQFERLEEDLAVLMVTFLTNHPDGMGAIWRNLARARMMVEHFKKEEEVTRRRKSIKVLYQ